MRSMRVVTDGPAADSQLEPLVEATSLNKTFHSGAVGPVHAVKDVSLSIRRGETLGLVGESGSGKSTVARMLMALEVPDSGSVSLLGRSLETMAASELRDYRRNFQIVLQDPFAALNRRRTVEQLIRQPLDVHKLGSRASRQERVGELLDLVGLPQAFRHRLPHEMSGGQCQRVGIARALAVEPSFLVLDEAVSAVDVCVQAQILNLLRAVQNRLGLTYLFVSHNLAVVRYMSDEVAVMYRGEIVERGIRGDLFSRPQHPYTVSLLSSIPRTDGGPAADHAVIDSDDAADVDGGTPAGCSFRPRCPIGKDRELCAIESPALRGGRHQVMCHFSDEVERLLPPLKSAGAS